MAERTTTYIPGSPTSSSGVKQAYVPAVPPTPYQVPQAEQARIAALNTARIKEEQETRQQVQVKELPNLEADLKREQGQLAEILSRRTPDTEVLRSRTQTQASNVPPKAIAQDPKLAGQLDPAVIKQIRNQTYFDQLGVDAETARVLAQDIEEAGQALAAAEDLTDPSASQLQTYQTLNGLHRQVTRRLEPSAERSSSSTPSVTQNVNTSSSSSPTPAGVISSQAAHQQAMEQARLREEQKARIADRAVNLALQQNQQLAHTRMLSELARRQHEKEQLQVQQAKKTADQTRAAKQGITLAGLPINLADQSKDKLAKAHEQRRAAAQMSAAHGGPVPPEFAGQVAPKDGSSINASGQAVDPVTAAPVQTLYVDTFAVDEETGRPSGDYLTAVSAGANVKGAANRVGVDAKRAPRISAQQEDHGTLEGTSSATPAVALHQQEVGQDSAEMAFEPVFGPNKPAK